MKSARAKRSKASVVTADETEQDREHMFALFVAINMLATLAIVAAVVLAR